MRQIIIWGLLFMSLPASAHNLSIKEYERQVIDYSLELKVALNRRDKTAGQISVAKLLRLPKLAAGGRYEHNFRQEEGVRDWYFNIQPQITQSIYTGGSIKAKVKLAELEQEVTICDMEFTALEVRYAADYAFWSLVAAERYRNAMREYVKIISSLQRVVDRRFNEGYISKNDVLMIASRLSEAEYEMVSSEESYRVALHNLNTLRGFNVNAEVVPDRCDIDGLVAIDRISIDDIIKRRPDYTSAEIDIEMSNESTNIVKAGYMPQLNLGIKSVVQSLHSQTADKARVDGGVFFELSVPIFHFGERKKAVGVAVYDEQYYELAIDLLRDNITREETNSWTILQQSHAQLVAAKKSLEIANESLLISTYSYNEGLAIILDVMQAQISWIQVYTNSINSEFNYLVARSLYEKITVMN